MKKIAFLLLLLPIISYSQKAKEQTIVSEVKKVKLFLTSGEMTHEISVKLEKGRNKLVFSGISAFADPNSIQFTGKSGFRLVSVSTVIDFLAAENYNPHIKTLKDSLESMKDNLQLNIDMVSAYNAELTVLNTNRDIKGKDQNLTVEQLKAAGEFFRTRTLEINKAVSKLNKAQRILKADIDATRQQLAELNYNENQRSNQIIILVDCDENVSVETTLKYLVSDCGWVANYELNAVDINQPVKLKYKAQVYNNTGNEWKDVQLSLSTADPTLSASAPNMSPFYLEYNAYIEEQRGSYITPQSVQQNYRIQAENEINWANQRAYDNYILDKNDDASENRFLMNKEALNMSSYLSDASFSSGKKVSKVQTQQIQISELTTEFTVPATFSCPSDAKPYLVEIKEITIPATFSHVSIPKLDQGAFLLANIVGWQDLDLIPGPTAVYFSGNFVGMSQIDTRNVNDTLSLSFGRDSKIQVLRKLKSEMSVKKVVGSNKRDTYYYDIQLRNNRTVPVTIDVFDQIPLSRNSEITVSVETIGTGKKNDITGEVSYKVTLQPGESTNLEIGYTVKYPKVYNVKTKTYYTRESAKF
jgi:predicted lactoylglutathione lyase